VQELIIFVSNSSNFEKVFEQDWMYDFTSITYWLMFSSFPFSKHNYIER